MVWYAMLSYAMVWKVWYALGFQCYAMRFLYYAMLFGYVVKDKHRATVLNIKKNPLFVYDTVLTIAMS